MPSPAFTAAPALAPRAPVATASDPLHAPRRALVVGRKRARQLVYGAGGAFRGLASPRERIAELVRMSGGRFATSRSGGDPPSGGRGGAGGGHNHHNDDDDEWNVDPSWGAAPGVHVVLRGKTDEAYRLAVANIVAMGAALNPMNAQAFVGDPAVPVVIILSWMGAQQKHLAKYKAFYEELGYEVHCVFNGLKTAVFPPASKAQAKKIGEFIGAQPEERPVLIHAFSIGTGIYGLLLDSIRHETEELESLRKKVVGVVFDSGPAPIFPKDVAVGLHTVCPMISRAIWEPIANAFFFVTKARVSYGRGEDALRSVHFPSPQLYFYSGDDKVIPGIQHAVEEFIEKNKQRGVEVYNKFWEKSVHASHLKVHPEEYLGNLQHFVNRCMEVRQQNLRLPAPQAAK